MARWNYKVRIKHLMTDKEDYKSIKKSMNDIADVLDKEICFFGFNRKEFRKIKKGDSVLSSLDYANKLIARMYDYADSHRIWIE